MNRPEKPKAINKLVFLVGLFLAGSIIPTRFTYTVTDSVKYHLFFVKRIQNVAEIKKNDFVMFNLRIPEYIHPNCSPCTLIKQVGCIEGEILKIIGNKFYCADGSETIYLGAAKSHSKKGIKVEQYKRPGKIPTKQLFLSAPNSDSYDSRYFGLVHRSKVEAIAIPII